MKRVFRPSIALLLIALLHGTGCDSSKQTASGLPTTNMRLGSGNFIIEIANTDPTRMTGLMKRDSMPPNHGMIFVFATEEPRGFWMKNVRIPLDIVFLDSAGKIVSIRQMKAYDITTTPSDKPAKYAIELNEGAAARFGLAPGLRIDIPPEAREAKN